jgi:hypothetical protein
MHDMRDFRSANPIRCLDLGLHFCKQQLKAEMDRQVWLPAMCNPRRQKRVKPQQESGVAASHPIKAHVTMHANGPPHQDQGCNRVELTQVAFREQGKQGRLSDSPLSQSTLYPMADVQNDMQGWMRVR